MCAKSIRVTQGVEPWAILQQEEGFAKLLLEGVWECEKAYDPASIAISIRVILEETGKIVARSTSNRMLAEGSWTAEILQIPSGGLYRIEPYMTSLKAEDSWEFRGEMIHHVGVGDIWVIAGQSNAQGAGAGDYSDLPELGIHLFRNNQQWDLATHPLRDDALHSPFMTFAKEVKKAVHHPIGLLQTAVGATYLQLWNPAENGCLYRSMLDVIKRVGGKVRGVLWYQGESDAAWYWYEDCSSEEPHTYLSRFSQMVETSRQDLGNAELPYLTLQLNRTAFTGYPGENHSWGSLREMQRRAASTMKHVYVMPTLDCALSDPIHNGTQGNKTIGERLAKTALAEVYGIAMAYRAPNLIHAVYGGATEEGKQTIELQFEHVQGSLRAIDPQAQVFSVEDDVGLVQIDVWQVKENDKIVVVLKRDCCGKAVIHGAHEANPAYSLPMDSVTGLPILAFYSFEVRGG
ncbi:sialate O-acetylesterase [Paenibacillus eucommiae]|uniref:Sialate O-acetylesterase domain-containing protein n=1 Tax=Paenibacillus eucommiae TaxID=1355755 RepID=A0ABS4IZJ5_9BACL|nr:sialate O-acetylesterase [Paenibacillus eucommiae]MBP1992991.1 hypothetical protein [Paenibacillus eucommiae]